MYWRQFARYDIAYALQVLLTVAYSIGSLFNPLPGADYIRGFSFFIRTINTSLELVEI